MMVHILAKAQLPALAHFAASNVLLAFDYDGTLAPIVADHTFAPMRATTRRLLRAVALRYPCVVISGRSRADLAACVDNVPVWHLAGNHGLEPWGEDPRHVARVRQWVRALVPKLRPYHGVVVEDKTYSVTIHYRRAERKARALAAIDRAVGALSGVRALGGKQAISLIPRGAMDKSGALERARRLLACDSAIYVGDDDTDEHAFRRRADRVLGVRVGARRGSHARYFLRSQREIDSLLKALIALRPIRRRVGSRSAAGAGS
jgi:trehalose 6-phosphate phosphatase